MSHRKRFLLIVAATLGVCAAIFSFAPGNLNVVLVRPLIALVATDVSRADLAVVLGAGLQKSGELSNIAQERVGHALFVHQQMNLPLMMSGGETPYGVEAVEMNAYAKRYGYDGLDHMEASSRSTYQNALYSDQLLDEGRFADDTVLVITSLYHSRRALATFTYVMPERNIFITYPERSAVLQDDVLSRWKGLYAIMREYAANAWYALRYGIRG